MLTKEERARRAGMVGDVLYKHGIPTLKLRVSDIVEEKLPNPPNEVKRDIVEYDWVNLLNSLAPILQQEIFGDVIAEVDKFTHMTNEYITGRDKSQLETYLQETEE